MKRLNLALWTAGVMFLGLSTTGGDGCNGSQCHQQSGQSCTQGSSNDCCVSPNSCGGGNVCCIFSGFGPCTLNTDCCANLVCAATGSGPSVCTSCLQTGSRCSSDGECCGSDVCLDGQCGTPLEAVDAGQCLGAAEGPCTSSGDCCLGTEFLSCVGGVCTPYQGTTGASSGGTTAAISETTTGGQSTTSGTGTSGGTSGGSSSISGGTGGGCASPGASCNSTPCCASNGTFCVGRPGQLNCEYSGGLPDAGFCWGAGGSSNCNGTLPCCVDGSCVNGSCCVSAGGFCDEERPCCGTLSCIGEAPSQTAFGLGKLPAGICQPYCAPVGYSGTCCAGETLQGPTCVASGTPTTLLGGACSSNPECVSGDCDSAGFCCTGVQTACTTNEECCGYNQQPSLALCVDGGCCYPSGSFCATGDAPDPTCCSGMCNSAGQCL